VLTLSDVMCTGHHAAVSAGVKPGSVVAVVGDGAVGLCAVIAAQRLGAARIIALSRNPARQALARSFGATDIIVERGDAATEALMQMTDGLVSTPPWNASVPASPWRRRSVSPDAFYVRSWRGRTASRFRAAQDRREGHIQARGGKTLSSSQPRMTSTIRSTPHTAPSTDIPPPSSSRW